MNVNRRKRFFSREKITAASVLFLTVSLIVTFISGRYMNECLNKETQAQQNRIILHNLGERFAETSDYLTDEARRFALTGDIDALCNYWNEVYITREREKIISEISENSLPDDERRLLSEAKAYSDMLISTETLSMKLMLLSEQDVVYDINDYTINSYISHVMSYELPDEYNNLTSDELFHLSGSILYDSYYYNSKELIMSPISEFQLAMDNRLDKAVEEAIKGKNTAFVAQIVSSVFVILILAVTVFAFSMLYVTPLKKYSEKFSALDFREYFRDNDYSMIQTESYGAYELYNFAQAYNKMSAALKNELRWHIESEEKLRAARDEANRANKAKSVFLAHMSHELRTPLNAIVGYIYLLENTKLGSEQKKYCDNIEYSSKNLLEIINNILDFSKMESGNMNFENSEFSLHHLLNDVYGMMKNSAVQKSLEFSLEIGDSVPEYIKGDQLRLRQVLVNLIGNAVKFTDKGWVAVKAETISCSKEEYAVRFLISDSGKGVPTAKQKSIFDPFVQSDAGVTRKYGGTGLGLPISQRIIEEMSNGEYKIEVESDGENGSVFSFCLNFEKALKIQNVSEKKEIISVIKGDTEVLLVDDNEINLEMESKILESLGIRTTAASCGKDAVKYAERKKYNAVLLDLHMPEMDGYETALKLRQLINCRNIPIIALSADVESDVNEKVRKFGMNGCISKPFRISQLKDAVENGIQSYIKESSDSASQEVFDYEECLQKLGGDEKVLQELIEKFLKKHMNDADYIVSDINQGLNRNADMMLHNIIGISGNLCCYKLYDEAGLLLSRLRNGEAADTESFIKIWNETIEMLSGYRFESGDLSQKEFIADSDAVIETFIALCRDFDISAKDYFNDNSGVFSNILSEERYTELEKYLDSFDFVSINNKYGKKENYV